LKINGAGEVILYSQEIVIGNPHIWTYGWLRWQLRWRLAIL